MEELIQLLKEEIQTVDPVLLISVLSGIAVFVLELILYSKGIIFSAGEKRLEKAKKLGHTVTAHRVHINFEDRRNDSGQMDRVWVAKYEYTFQGIRGYKVIISHHGAPGTTLTLYHDGKAVYTDTEMRQHKRSFLLMIIPIVVMLLVAKLLGYQP